MAKRYRYTGKERDEESGLYYHGARYYIPWLARWTAVDPSESKNAPKSSYGYCSNNPITKFDPDGKDEIHFNYLYVKREVQNTNDFNRYGVDSNDPKHFGVATSVYEVYRWISVKKNDLPNTYHIDRFEETISYGKSDFDPQRTSHTVVTSSEVETLNPKSGYVPEGLEVLYNAVSDFSGELNSSYGSIISSTYGGKTQSQRNTDNVHKLIADTRKFNQYQKEKEAELDLLKFAAVTVASELLFLKLANGATWIGRLKKDNIIPERLVRVIPEEFANSPTLGAPGSLDVFVTTATDLKGIETSEGIAKRLSLLNKDGSTVKGPFRLIEFDVPTTGLAQPIRRTNPGFIHGGKTAGGATEFVIPNYNISDLKNVTQRTIK